jgi:alkylation response protein AidB-like acyl-CoA dehydrogenase
LLAAGSEEQKARFLTMLTQKASLAGYGSNDSMANELTVMQERSEFIINGQHSSVINAGQAQWYFFYALTATDSEAAQTESFAGGLSAFIVPADSPGLTFGERVSSLGRKARSVHKAKLKNVRLTAEHLIGKSHQANQVAIEILPGVCALIAAGATGVAHSAMQHAIAYAKERKTFGRPIGQHQGVAFILADMAREIEAARLMTWQAACLIDQGLKTAEHALAAKAYAQDVAMRVATDAVQVFGGYGYSREYPVEKLMRDAKQYQIFERSSLESKAALARRLVRA